MAIIGNVQILGDLVDQSLTCLLEPHVAALVPETHIEPPPSHLQVQERVLEAVYGFLIELGFRFLGAYCIRCMQDIETDFIWVP